MTDPILQPADPGPLLEVVRAEGLLVQAPGSSFGAQVFLALRGRRHPVRSREVVEAYGFRWPEDLRIVDERTVRTWRPGGPLPFPWRSAPDPDGITDPREMRELLGSTLSGSGVEVGASASPFPVSPLCRVRYTDLFGIERIRANLPRDVPGGDAVEPELITSMNELSGIPDGSLDFLIASHVIEHTKDPIGAIRRAWEVLRPGGRLILVIPQADRTFDRDRPRTPLAHLLEDHRAPSADRDLDHYREFLRDVYAVPERALEHTATDHQRRDEAIHFHVWDHPAWLGFIGEIQATLVPWSASWSHAAVGEPPNGNEMVTVLVR